MKPYSPKKYTPEDAAHLLRRAGFGGSSQEIAKLAELGPELAFERLLYASSDDGTEQNPFDLQKLFLERQATGKGIGATNGLFGWWVYKMVHTSQPFKEKLTLFWHGHFATEIAKVENPFAMRQQNQTLRQLGLGRFEALVQAISKDPAMIRYLDNNRNVKGKPNENYARELLELFTLGVNGGYSETDVQESARAFTGWTFSSGNPQNPNDNPKYMDPKFVFNKNQFDDGEKTYLGQRGKLRGEDVVRIAAAHPSTAKFIITKLWQFFVSDVLAPSDLESLLQVWNNSGGEIASVLRLMLTSEVFYANKTRYALVKSPADYVIGTLRRLEQKTTAEQCLGAYNAMQNMGQRLFNPPNVKGWDGGTDWISDTTLLYRLNFIGAIASLNPPVVLQAGQTKPPAGYTLTPGKSATASLEQLGLLFLDAAPETNFKRSLEQYAAGKNTQDTIKGMAYMILGSPQYHLC
jgi:uncharacterized protein (DUF1800 family)